MHLFYKKLAHILNSNQSRSVVLSGNVYDLFFDGTNWLPLLHFLERRTQHESLIRVVYELNGPIRIEDEDAVRKAFIEFRTGKDEYDLQVEDMTLSSKRMRAISRRESPTQRTSELEAANAKFYEFLREAQGNAPYALSFLRQLCMASRANLKGRSLLIFIEAADMLLPAGKDIGSLNPRDRKSIAIAQDWFCDPAFCNGKDSVCLIAESASQIHERVARLPQVLSVEIPSPNYQERLAYLEWFAKEGAIKRSANEEWSLSNLATLTAGLSVHAIRQLGHGARYSEEALTPDLLVDKIEAFIKAQVGDDVIEFKKPEHTLEDVIGFSNLKQFLKRELIPRFRATGDRALPGAAVGGPIGAGKTFIFEAVAAELDVPVIVLKNLRSQWYGQTDVIFERLRRVLEALEKVIIFVDEADTQFGSVGEEAHSTERRLTGKIQAMMSDSKLRGKVTWLLMTARIHLLSPDIRRPGRVGDLIIPILDPEGEDRAEFCRWVVEGCGFAVNDATLAYVEKATEGFSAAGFASLRSNLKACRPDSLQTMKEIIEDQIPPNIGLAREYQTLQALINCTRRSLLPDGVKSTDRGIWEQRIRAMEAQGIS